MKSLFLGGSYKVMFIFRAVGLWSSELFSFFEDNESLDYSPFGAMGHFLSYWGFGIIDLWTIEP